MNRDQLKNAVLLVSYVALLAAALFKLDLLIGALGQLLRLLTPVLLGGALAFVLKRPQAYIERTLCGRLRVRKGARALSLLLTYLLLLGALSVIVSVLVPQLYESVLLLQENIIAAVPRINRWALELQQRVDIWQLDLTPVYELLQKLPEKAGQLLLGAVPQIFSVTNSVVRSLTNVVLALVFSVYFLFTREQLARQSRDFVRAFFRRSTGDLLLHVAHVADATFTRFVGGQLTEACILGSLCTLGMALLRLEYALLIGVIIGITSLIPIVGAFLGGVPAVFILLMINPRHALVFLVFLLVLQQFEGNIIYPKVVGGSLGLPGLWILMAVTVGGGLMGVVGMLLAVPVTSVAYQLLGESIVRRLRRKAKIEQIRPE